MGALDLQKAGKADMAINAPHANVRTDPLPVGVRLVEDVPATPTAARLPNERLMDRDNGTNSTFQLLDGQDVDVSAKDGAGILASRGREEDGTPLRHISAAVLQLIHGDVSSEASSCILGVSSEAPAQICKDSDNVVGSDGEVWSCGTKRALSEASTLAPTQNDSDAEDSCGVYAV